jgi:hypothetical protein
VVRAWKAARISAIACLNVQALRITVIIFAKSIRIRSPIHGAVVPSWHLLVMQEEHIWAPLLRRLTHTNMCRNILVFVAMVAVTTAVQACLHAELSAAAILRVQA